MANQVLPANISFVPEGVWTETKVVRFFFDDDADKEVRNASASNLYGQRKYFEAPCRTVKSFMEHFGHEAVNVIKLDIEGAALAVVENLIDEGVRPRQLVCEFEYPRGLGRMVEWSRSFQKVVSRLNDVGYDVIRLPRDELPYFSVEILALSRSGC